MNKKHKIITLKDWFTSACLELKSIQGVGVDVDYFGFGKMTRMRYVRVGIDMLNQVIELCKQEGMLDDIAPMLIISLRGSKFVTLDSMNFTLTENKLDISSPPNLCLFYRDSKKHHHMRDDVVEEYIRDVKLSPKLPISKNCRIYYSCKRDIWAIANNWQDFGRVIYIEHYTDELLK